MHLILCFLAARALTTRRSILYIQSAKDGKYLNLKGDFDDLEKIKHHFQSELETEKGAPPYIKIRDEKNRYLSVKDDTLWWTEEDLGFKWNSSFVETSEGMLSDQNGKCFAREGSQITLKNCNDIINDVEVSHFKLIFAPTAEEVKHAQSVLEAADREKSRMQLRENDGAGRGEGRFQYSPLDRPGGGKSMGSSRNGISDPLVCPMRGMPGGGPGLYSPGRYGPSGSSPDNLPRNWVENGRLPERDASVPPRGMEGTPQGGLSDERPVKDRDLDGVSRSYAGRPLEGEQGNAGDPYSTQDYSNALKRPLSKAGGHGEISSDPIKALDDLKRMLEDNQRKVLETAEIQKEKVRNDVGRTKDEVLNNLRNDISKLQKANDGSPSSPAARSTGDGSVPADPLEEKHSVNQYKELKKIKETLQSLQEQVDPLLERETSTSNLTSHGRRAG